MTSNTSKPPSPYIHIDANIAQVLPLTEEKHRQALPDANSTNPGFAYYKQALAVANAWNKHHEDKIKQTQFIRATASVLAVASTTLGFMFSPVAIGFWITGAACAVIAFLAKKPMLTDKEEDRKTDLQQTLQREEGLMQRTIKELQDLTEPRETIPIPVESKGQEK